ncbi:UDP-2,3-diacylglucosamine diphosphatase [Mucilaginibacter ginsenosidivorans]|uniref:UDP-2,3-diacylglucosamine diphosphatase n=1 Tax=Mucilaginibacter ginsenosidivorans TaxID=398053 RepID=A0A5B8UQG3_9SPHI|nr:UDP-2,3-diacylglucosamine diphosphatase [Mucilaginibacter ginsenosidivorans]QEC61122.1 UDP-2,3-diacylglucosamine diphosphatase [Mucilaginibacter ginsenosidivorans]
MAKREVDIVVISDVHLGTYGCHSKELLKYLKSIKPKMLILNGDIIDIWQFSKSYWPETHMKVVRRILKFVTEGVPVYYLTGNHDEMLRKFADFDLGSFQLKNKVVLNIDGKKAWIFHGDIFDVTMQHSKWLAKLGAVGYDTLILINSFVNWFLAKIGREKMSFSKKVKGKFKDAVKFINQFEQTAADLAVEKKYSYVICGHIHQAEMRVMQSTDGSGSVLYLNSGDWVESLTALEYHNREWTIFKYDPANFRTDTDEEDLTDAEDLDAKMDVRNLLERFKLEVH